MIFNNIFNNKNIIKSLISIIFFINFKISNALASIEDLEKKKSEINTIDFENYFDFIDNFDKKEYAEFIMHISNRFNSKLNSSYTYVWTKIHHNRHDDYNYFFFRMCGNIVNRLTSGHGIISNNIKNIRLEHSKISPFLTKEFGIDVINQRTAHFPIYLADIYTKAKLHFNTTGFKNNFFQNFFNTNSKKNIVDFYNSYKINAIASVYDWWASINDCYYIDYAILIFFFFSSFFISFIILTISNLVGNSPSIFFERSKTSVYECGFQPFERIDKCQIFVFYRLSIFFIIFEAELIFLYPWAINVCEIAIYSISFFYNASFFIFILFYGFIFEIKNKALDV